MIWLLAIPGVFALFIFHQKWDEAMEARHGEA